MNIISTNGTHFTVTNKAKIKKSKFSVTFSVVYEYETKAEKCFQRPDAIARGLFFKPICSGVVLVKVSLVWCFIAFFKK